MPLTGADSNIILNLARYYPSTLLFSEVTYFLSYVLRNYSAFFSIVYLIYHQLLLDFSIKDFHRIREILLWDFSPQHLILVVQTICQRTLLCALKDSNLYPVRDLLLRQARLPIPPNAHLIFLLQRYNNFLEWPNFFKYFLSFFINFF